MTEWRDRSSSSASFPPAQFERSFGVVTFFFSRQDATTALVLSLILFFCCCSAVPLGVLPPSPGLYRVYLSCLTKGFHDWSGGGSVPGGWGSCHLFRALLLFTVFFSRYIVVVGGGGGAVAAASLRSGCLLAITRPYASGFDCAHMGDSGGAVRYSASGFPSMLAVRDALDFCFVFMCSTPGMGVPAPAFLVPIRSGFL